jgi:integrase
MPTPTRCFSTAREVDGLKPDQAGRIEVPDAHCPGLYLIVQPSGSKSWAVRYRADGKPAKLTLARYPRMSLADAREAARAALRDVARGADPAARKRVLKDAGGNTLADHVDVFIRKHARPRNRSWAEQKRHLDVYVIPSLGARDVEAITRREVIELLDRIAGRKLKAKREDGKRVVRGGPTQANRVLTTLRRLFNWLVERDVIPASPVAGVKAPAPETRRDRVLTDGELREVWCAAETVGHPIEAIVKLLILTAARRDEIGGARWSWVQGSAIVVPADAYKTARSHMIPLASAALAIVDGLARVDGSEWLFPARGASERPVSGFSDMKERIDRAITKARVERGDEPMPGWTLHDLRRTARTGLSALKVPPHVAEAVLGHVLPGVQGVYDHHTYADEKRAALEAWADHVAGLVKANGVRRDGSVRS